MKTFFLATTASLLIIPYQMPLVFKIQWSSCNLSVTNHWIFKHIFCSLEYSTHSEPHRPVLRANQSINQSHLYTFSCKMLNSTDLANWRCFFMQDLKRILELRFDNHSQREIYRMLKVSRNTAYNLSEFILKPMNFFFH